MARVLVTGGTGFIGRHLVARLTQQGDEVRCLVREEKLASHLESLGAHLVLGDITDASSLQKAVQHVDVVYHLAGLIKALSAKEFFRVNQQGPHLLAQACVSQTTPPVMVAVSSLAAAGPSLIDQPKQEADPSLPVSQYGRSKLAGEQAAMAFADRMGLTILRPPVVFGPGDRVTFDWFRSVARGWHLVPGWRESQLSFLHVHDLTEVMLQAAAHGERVPADAAKSGLSTGKGYYYPAHVERPTFFHFGQLLADALGRTRVRTVRVPGPLLWTFAGAAQTLAFLRRKPSLLAWDKIRESLAGSWICDGQKTYASFGHPHQNLEVRLRETALWYFEKGWLPGPSPAMEDQHLNVPLHKG